jgi:hypothetical protein
LEHPFPDVTFLGIHFDFETKIGPASGIARLVYEDDKWKAFTVFTLLEGIAGHPQRVGSHRARGSHNDKLSYDERRSEEGEFTDSSPDVLIGKRCRDQWSRDTDSRQSAAVTTDSRWPPS